MENIKCAIEDGEDIILCTETRIFRFDSGRTLNLLCGGGVKGSEDGIGSNAFFSQIAAIAKLGEDFIVSDKGNHTIRKIFKKYETDNNSNSNSSYQTSIISGTRALPGSSASFHNQPSSIAVDRKGNIYVWDEGTNYLRKISGNKTTTIHEETHVRNLFLTTSGNEVFFGVNYIKKIDEDGNVSLFVKEAKDRNDFKNEAEKVSEAVTGYITAMASDSQGNIYFNQKPFTIRKISSNLDEVKNLVICSNNIQPISLSCTKRGSLLICDTLGDLYELVPESDPYKFTLTKILQKNLIQNQPKNEIDLTGPSLAQIQRIHKLKEELSNELSETKKKLEKVEAEKEEISKQLSETRAENEKLKKRNDPSVNILFVILAFLMALFVGRFI